MNKHILLVLLTISTVTYSQGDLTDHYRKAENLMQKNMYSEAFNLFKTIEPQCSKADTLYQYILWYYTNAASIIEKNFRDRQQFDSSLYYGKIALNLVKTGKAVLR